MRPCLKQMRLWVHSRLQCPSAGPPGHSPSLANISPEHQALRSAELSEAMNRLKEACAVQLFRGQVEGHGSAMGHRPPSEADRKQPRGHPLHTEGRAKGTGAVGYPKQSLRCSLLRASFPWGKCPQVKVAQEGECRKEVTPTPPRPIPNPCLSSKVHFFLVPIQKSPVQ